MNLQDLTKGAIVPDTVQLRNLYTQYQVEAQSSGQTPVSFEDFAKQMGVNVLPPAGPLNPLNPLNPLKPLNR